MVIINLTIKPSEKNRFLRDRLQKARSFNILLSAFTKTLMENLLIWSLDNRTKAGQAK